MQGHQRRYTKVVNFTSSSTLAALCMLVAAIIALIIANVGNIYEPFNAFWETEVVIGIGPVEGEINLEEIINDVLMALFFLIVGLEIKYEMTVGELTNIRQAALPVIAAAGGVCAPIVIYLIFNASNPETVNGWGVPTATDIAFALGIMALLGDRVPSGIRVFLSTLAVADDIIAILVIAIFYNSNISIAWLLSAAVVFVILLICNKCHIFSIAPYVLLGIVLWFCVFMSGIHSTIAGVLLAFTIPSASRVNVRNFLSWSGKKVDEANSSFDKEKPLITQKGYLHTIDNLSKVSRQVIPPATRIEHALYPWVYFAVLPLFALTNADVHFIGGNLGDVFTSTTFIGVFLGLLLGKPIGIMLFSFLTVKLHISKLPDHVNWIHMIGAGILGGVGFTMAIFVANLAFDDPDIIADAKLGILCASLVAGIIGYLFLNHQANVAKKHGITYTDEGACLDIETEMKSEVEDVEEVEHEIVNEDEAHEDEDITGTRKP
ncbi:MAG: Na+/H+ antiporter NhaA [Eggerthellaceae bacterium]|nr:Na+/H+ antiporter NhaA [Eggerthellaceae bacterium]